MPKKKTETKKIKKNNKRKVSPKEEKKGNKIILIVEDDEVLLRALYVFFHESEYTIATATDGETAVSMAQRLNPDLILLDLLLPQMDGFQFLEKVKAMPKLKNIPVVVLSNLGDESDIKRAKALGAKDYFIKADVELSKLSENIKKVLK